MNDFKWSKAEEEIAKKAVDKASKREIDKMIQTIKENYKLDDPDKLWTLSEILNKQEKEIDQLHDYRNSRLGIVFLGILIKRGFLSIDELNGLSEDKLEQIKKIEDL